MFDELLKLSLGTAARRAHQRRRCVALFVAAGGPNKNRDLTTFDDLTYEDNLEATVGKSLGIEEHFGFDFRDDDAFVLSLIEVLLPCSIGAGQKSGGLNRIRAIPAQRSGCDPGHDDRSGRSPSGARGKRSAKCERARRIAADREMHTLGERRRLQRETLQSIVVTLCFGEQFPRTRFGRCDAAELVPLVGGLEPVDDAADEDVDAVLGHGESIGERKASRSRRSAPELVGVADTQVSDRLFPKHATAADDAVLDGGLGQIHHLRDVGVREIVNEPKQKRLGVSGRKRGKACSESIGGVLGCAAASVGDARGRAFAGSINRFAARESVHRRVSTAGAACGHAGRVQRHAAEPTRKGLGIPQRVDSRDERRRNFLKEILKVGVAGLVEQQHRGNPAPMPLPKPLKRLPVADLGCGKEDLVVEVRHERNVS